VSFYLLIVGFVSILGQVIILRELNVSFYGIELIYILSFGFWLFGTSIGAITGRRSFTPTQKQISLLAFLWGVLLLSDVFFIRSVRYITGHVSGVFLPFEIQIIALAVSLIPVSFLLGLMFQWAAKIYIEKNKTLAKAYAIESLGGVFGGFISTLTLKFGMQNFTIAVICTIISLGLAYLYSSDIKRNYYRTIILICLILMVPLLLFSSLLDNKMSKINHPDLAEVKDTPYGRISISSLGNQISVFENDALSYETESTAPEEFVQLSLLQHKNPKTVLILGGGFEGIINELNKYKLEKIIYVEFNKDLIKLLKKYLPVSFGKNNLKIIINDPRKYLKNSSKYDIILIGMPEPSSGQTNRFYTKEFFELCSKHLSNKGILSFRLRSSENLWPPPLILRNISIYRALSSTFNSIVVLPGVTNIFISSNSLLSNDENFLADRLIARNLKTKLITPQYVKYIYSNDRKFEIENILSNNLAPVNTDSRPICYQYSIAIWLSKFFPDINSLKFSFFSPNSKTNLLTYFLLVIPILIIFLIGKFSPKIRRFIIVFIAGFLGMVFETILILHYQVTSGILFQDIGILLMAFMFGLVLGSFSINNFAHKKNKELFISRWAGTALFAGFGLFNLVFILTLGKIEFGLLGISILLIISGFFVAGVFAYAGFCTVKDQKLVVSPLYSADLIGGCLGSLAASLFLIPLAGLQTTCVFLAVFSFISLVLV